MKKTTADVPPKVAGEYKKAPRPSAVASAVADGYTETKPMKKAQQSKSQFGLPPSPGKGGPGVRLRIHVIPDDGM